MIAAANRVDGRVLLLSTLVKERATTHPLIHIYQLSFKDKETEGHVRFRKSKYEDTEPGSCH
jgi:hypothetical protein